MPGRTSILATPVLATAQAVTKNGTVYTNVCQFHRCVGDAAVRLVSTAGSITVTQQCSLDYSDRNPSAATWDNPYKTVSGTTSAAGVVVSAQTVTTGIYITYSPVIAPYIRFKIVEGDVAATAVSLTLIFREEV